MKFKKNNRILFTFANIAKISHNKRIDYICFDKFFELFLYFLFLMVKVELEKIRNQFPLKPLVIIGNKADKLDESEKAWPYKDQKPDKATKNFYNQLVEIFDSVGEPGRKLYRSLLTRINQGEVLTSEQMLYELLKEEAKDIHDFE